MAKHEKVSKCFAQVVVRGVLSLPYQTFTMEHLLEYGFFPLTILAKSSIINI